MNVINVAWLLIIAVLVLSPVALFFDVELWQWLTVVFSEIIFLTVLGVLKDE
jgi:hypothetical protein